ncbi:iron-siderophore ABC transporter substrate-binding protein [Terrihabitans sp. B22-R8]|uniref:iron-siderophore ABC transporter substrate-binding protein n=1 Tax=Terrihabitans sp. B22-R8 TaxID=3425128 RepID=UPI00403CD4D1
MISHTVRGAMPSSPTRRHVVFGLAGCLFASFLAGKARAQDGAIRFEHAFGEIVLPRPASRVVSLGYTTHDTLLALGLPPIAVRHWYGGYPFGVWPWAQPYLGGAEPILFSGEVPIEKVAALAPDLIVGIGSGISHAEYDVLSRIAPVLMHERDHTTYGTSWEAMTRVLGRAIGRDGRAEELIRETRQTFADARARNQVWHGKTAVAAYHTGGETGAFLGSDTRARFLADLGFEPTPQVRELSGPEGFFAPLSSEDLTPIDADVLVWISAMTQVSDLVDLPMRQTLRAHREGREVFAGPLLAGAMSHGSVLSLPFALKALEADLTAAADGRPETKVSSAVEAGLAS